MNTVDHYGVEASIRLLGKSWSILDAPQYVGQVPGLYAIHASEPQWVELGLDYRNRVPLYVGKSQSSLFDRELGQHFAINPAKPARTGSSTVRRSFAALLREPLGLTGVPRNKRAPERYSNFGLEPEGDLLLTKWMHSHLTLSVWPLPDELSAGQLSVVEVGVIQDLRPPLNIKDNPGRLAHLRLARAQLASEAKTWSREQAILPESLLN